MPSSRTEKEELPENKKKNELNFISNVRE